MEVESSIKNKKIHVVPEEKVVLTKDNLIRHNWDGSKQYSFCLHNEAIQHLSYECYYARFL
jgi:hypothetical protein